MWLKLTKPLSWTPSIMSPCFDTNELIQLRNLKFICYWQHYIHRQIHWISKQKFVQNHRYERKPWQTWSHYKSKRQFYLLTKGRNITENPVEVQVRIQLALKRDFYREKDKTSCSGKVQALQADWKPGEWLHTRSWCMALYSDPCIQSTFQLERTPIWYTTGMEHFSWRPVVKSAQKIWKGSTRCARWNE